MDKAFYGENSMVGNLSVLIVSETSRIAIGALEDSICGDAGAHERREAELLPVTAG